MARGRKKDHTIPPTRALTLQRDYRARKTQYIADLEARCKAAEEENVRLRKELELARQGVPQSTLTPEAIQASAQLRETLIAASTSLSHFMQVAIPPNHGSDATQSYTTLLDSLSNAALTQSLSRTDEITVHNVGSADCQDNRSRPESPCCGGYIICEGLVEDEDYPQDSSMTAAISQLRSTSGGPKPFA